MGWSYRSGQAGRSDGGTITRCLCQTSAPNKGRQATPDSVRLYLSWQDKGVSGVIVRELLSHSDSDPQHYLSLPVGNHMFKVLSHLHRPCTLLPNDFSSNSLLV
jgi:hypothetical protein